jgi:demethylmenaquinone methyltransferase/2-methoxy-6-polyprenyl-1,4-benzoquinol methylase
VTRGALFRRDSAAAKQSAQNMGGNEVTEAGEPGAPDILPVPRSKEEARRSYDRISRFYDYLTGAFERKYALMALERLSIQEGDRVLEIGFGTGHCLRHIAESVGQTGKACGIDISSGMLQVAKRRLGRAGLMDRAELYCGDAATLPYGDSTFDAVFMSFTLELFDTPEIPRVLEEIKRVLRPGGRLGVASMSKAGGRPFLLRLYEWAHQKWPKHIDCRPIFVEQALIDAGYATTSKEMVRLFGLPGEIVVAVNVKR